MSYTIVAHFVKLCSKYCIMHKLFTFHSLGDVRLNQVQMCSQLPLPSAILMEPRLSPSVESLCTGAGTSPIWCCCHRCAKPAGPASESEQLAWLTHWRMGGVELSGSDEFHSCPQMSGIQSWFAIVCDHGIRNSMSSKHFCQLVNSVLASGSRYHSYLQPL